MSAALSKSCSICGTTYPEANFSYGNRENRSYCYACSKACAAEYKLGGKEAAQIYRENMRSKWQLK